MKVWRGEDIDWKTIEDEHMPKHKLSGLWHSET